MKLRCGGDPREAIRREAEGIGFDRVGFARAGRTEAGEALKRWLGNGYEGGMAWMRRDPETRADPKRLAAWAKSIVCAAVSYDTEAPASTDPRPADRGWISRYAWGDDYHDRFTRMLRGLADAIRKIGGEGTRTRVCMDTAPALDRAHAAAAGLGWIGKNTMLLDRSLGSFLFLGEILTDLDLPSDPPETDHCGSCTACLDACPTAAFPEPGVLDARRCIAYLTIEHRGPIPDDLRPGMGTHLFGCDICQDVCPWNRRAPRPDRPEYRPRPGSAAPAIREILEMSLPDYRARFRGSPVKRAKYEGLLRNACVAAGNCGDPSLVPALRKAAAASPLVARHAAWAIRRIRSVGAPATAAPAAS